MPQLEQTRLHTVYLVDRYGDTLVVKPRGDAAGFSGAAVHSEMATLTHLVQQPEVKHLLIDLSGGNYYGSVILGSLIQLGQAVRSRDGRIGLCGASSDMQDVLRLMKLDQMWEMFPSLNAGLSAVAAIPLPEQLWRQRRSWAILLGIAALVLLIVFYPRPNYARLTYEELSKLWQEVEDRQELAGVDEWERLRKRMEKELAPIIERLERRGNRGLTSMGERYMLFAARDHWLHYMDRNDENRDFHRRMIQRYLRDVESELEGRPQ